MVATATFTYMRDAVPAEKMGQCPCCLKNHRSSKRGRLVRHGWKEQGRRVGQFGCGFQWGNCHGSGSRPLEQTDADGLTVLAQLATSITETGEAHDMHETKGAESYSHHFTISTHYERTPEAKAAKLAAIEAALKGLGVEFTSRETTEKRQSFRVYYETSQEFTVKIVRGAVAVPRGPGAFDLPAYETRRARVVDELAKMLKLLKRQRDDIKAAIKHHFENPSNGSKDTVRRANLVHLTTSYVRKAENCQPGLTVEQRTVKTVACGKRQNTMRGHVHLAQSTDLTHVTCAKCRSAAPKN